MKASPSGYTVTSDQAGAFALRVKVNNLSTRPQRIALTLALSEDAVGRERIVEVPADSATDVTFEMDLRPRLRNQPACTLVLTGNCAGMEPISPLALDIGLASPPPDNAPGS